MTWGGSWAHRWPAPSSLSSYGQGLQPHASPKNDGRDGVSLCPGAHQGRAGGRRPPLPLGAGERWGVRGARRTCRGAPPDPAGPGAAQGKSQRQLEARPSDPLPDEADDLADAASDEKASESQSVFNLVNAVLGAGVLGYPWAYKTCGLVLATLLVLITLVASELSMRLLMISSQLAGKRSYEELARHCFGRVGQRAVDFCVIIMNIGSLVAYLNILADMFSSVAGTIIPPGAEPSRNMLLLGEGAQC